MSKIVMCSDLHLGQKIDSKDFSNDCIEFFDYLIENSKDCDTLFFLGDWHHLRPVINIEILTSYSIPLFRKLSKAFKDVYFILGNHDLYFRNRRDVTSVEFLREFNNIHLIEEITEYKDSLLVPWMVNDDYHILKDKAKQFKPKYIFGHFEINSFVLNGVNECVNAELNIDDFNGPKYIFSGHFHKRQNKNNIWYIGNCFCNDFSDLNDEKNKGFVKLDWDSGELEFIEWNNAPIYRKETLESLFRNLSSYKNKKIYNQIIINEKIDNDDFMNIKKILSSNYNFRLIKPIFEIVEDSNDETIEVKKFANVSDTIRGYLKEIKSESINNNKLIKLFEEL